ncbi:hypothetical protein Tco_0249701, partial [Tanacetum coccineum]
MVVQAQTPPPTTTPTTTRRTTTTTTTSKPTPTPLLATTSIQPSQPQKQRVEGQQGRKLRPKLTELMALCTQLSSMVLALETTKSAQAKEIATLKKRV